jgi:hypothetical protein
MPYKTSCNLFFIIFIKLVIINLYKIVYLLLLLSHKYNRHDHHHVIIYICSNIKPMIGKRKMKKFHTMMKGRGKKLSISTNQVNIKSKLIPYLYNNNSNKKIYNT